MIVSNAVVCAIVIQTYDMVTNKAHSLIAPGGIILRCTVWKGMSCIHPVLAVRATSRFVVTYAIHDRWTPFKPSLPGCQCPACALLSTRSSYVGNALLRNLKHKIWLCVLQRSLFVAVSTRCDCAAGVEYRCASIAAGDSITCWSRCQV